MTVTVYRGTRQIGGGCTGIATASTRIMNPPRGVYMVDLQKNEQINRELSALYQKYTKEYLAAYRSIFHDPEPHRINEFGIIDVSRYKSGRGVLFAAISPKKGEHPIYLHFTGEGIVDFKTFAFLSM